MNLQENLPWIEKYRPSNLDDILSHSHIIKSLRLFIQKGNLPHLLLSGQSGTGKTSVIIACAKELFGADYNLKVLELNASNDRGIDVVRNKIKKFVCSSSFSNTKIFKMVILDEIDSMTVDAQAILRKVIEEYTPTTRFCLICNYLNKINSALQSRCICFRFSPLNFNSIDTKITNILSSEDITMDGDAKKTLYQYTNGDMRKVLNILQSLSARYKHIDNEIINNILNLPADEFINTLYDVIINNTFEYSHDYIYTYLDHNNIDFVSVVNNFFDLLLIYFKTDKFTNEEITNIIIKYRDLQKLLSNNNNSSHICYFISIFKLL